MAYHGKNPNLNSTVLEDQGVAAAVAAPTGKTRIINRDGTLFLVDDTGSEKEIGTGAGGKNYVLNPNAEISETADTTATNVTLGLETGSPVEGVQSFKITSQASAGTMDWAITIDDGYVTEGGILLGVSGFFRTDANPAEGDWKVGVYNTTDAAYVGGTEVDLKGDLLNVYRSVFVPLAGKTYVMRLEFVEATTASWVVDADLLKVTPDSSTALTELITGFDDEVTFTSLLDGSPGLGTQVTNYAKWKRIGNEMLVVFEYEQNTAGSNGTGIYFVNTPGGLTIDTNVLSGGYSVVGDWMYRDNANGHDWKLTNNITFESSNRLIFKYANNLDDSVPWQATSVPTFFASAMVVTGWFRLPILEWANEKTNLITPNLLQSNARVAYTLTGSTWSSGVAIPFSTEITGAGTNGVWQNAAGVITIPVDGTYEMTMTVHKNGGTFGGTQDILLYVNGGFSNPDIFETVYSAEDDRRGMGTLRKTLSGGDTIEIRSNGAETGVDANKSQLLIRRIADIGAHEPVGFGVATENTYGLMIGSNWKSFTPTGDMVSNATYTGMYRRQGNSLECQITINFSGGTANNMFINIPFGLTIDNTLFAMTGTTPLGTGVLHETGVQIVAADVRFSNTTQLFVQYHQVLGSLVDVDGDVNATTPFTWGAGDSAEFYFRVPILEWA